MVSEHLMERIKKNEGFSRKPYLDSVGKVTIGYGRNLEDRGISKSEAEYMLINDIHNAEDKLEEHLGYVLKNLNDARKEVLIEMVFNMGIYSVLKFKKMIKALTLGNYEKAADEMLDSKWAKQVKKRAIELSKIMKSGKRN